MKLDPIPKGDYAVKEDARLENWEPYRAPLAPGQHPHYPANGLKVLGKRLPLVDSPNKVTGQAMYTRQFGKHTCIIKFIAWYGFVIR